jgi:2'-5' RNA ligase
LKLANIVSEKFNTHTFVRSWKPHLTVWSWLFVPENKLDDVINDLSQIASKIKNTTIYIEWIWTIDNLNPKIAKNPYVVYVDIKLTPELQAIFDTLEIYQKFRKEWYEITKYSPHITLAYNDLTKDNFEKAVNFLKEENPNYEFTLNNFSIVRFNNKTEKWEEYRTFKFWIM